ncbi:LLM class flavin-dependent oxidoreductase [Paenibacillus sp. EPM92]|uniref:LLM class flavin-dependent oxidoreductase n=1 Tax=Paenibacillus sp. EPM92 TaxID=1561195 RepID=UPI0019161FFB|nr:LLM class flavin-dependent oxidoreductase [Paenibacillus sp. EPM92]
MAKKIRLNLFDMNVIGHLAHGIWNHPSDERRRFNELSYWVELAQLAERGKFDAIFLADILGVCDIYQQSRDISVKTGMQVPANDPMLIVPAMAQATTHLSFAVTISTTYEHPFSLARRLSTLDHLTNGRVAWNIVTTAVTSAARNFGLSEVIQHDNRYDIADEFLEVCYKLWEGSWEDDAVVLENGIYADPAKVHEINHQGQYFKVEGPHLCEPSSQRTPVIYQAGNSDRGRKFAARHAECVFVGGTSMDAVRYYTQDIREKAKAYGRDPEQLLMFKGLNVVVGKTAGEARDKFEDYKKYWSAEGAWAHFGGSTNLNLADYDPDEIFEYVETVGNQTHTAQYSKFGNKKRTVREVMEAIGDFGGSAGGANMVVGTPIEVADYIQHLVEEAGIDGINLAQVTTPGTVKDFIELVLPELQNRGLVKEEYEEGSYRQKLFGGNGRLPDHHPGARFRKVGLAK